MFFFNKDNLKRRGYLSNIEHYEYYNSDFSGFGFFFKMINE